MGNIETILSLTDNIFGQISRIVLMFSFVDFEQVKDKIKSETLKLFCL